MYSNTVLVSRPSEQEMAKARKFVQEVQEAKKDPEFRAALREFIKYHTGSK
ncbi:MAG: hypothetical protein HY917_03295 [Candidatus Diapherotrites archaeon]|nr:hypothetical protein [Candidatus Diapherotrites archaeon]